MIASFGDKRTERFFASGKALQRSKWKSVASVALRKLDMLDYAETLSDLKSPPGNRLEKLRGELSDYHSIRINEQWRIILVWKEDKAHAVSIVDYHR